jgi:hypothetical protein
MDFFCKPTLSFQPAREQLRRAIRALLIVWAAWQGPVPWCHAHGTLGNTEVDSHAFLRSHLSSHHAAIDPCGDLHFCWHVHYDFPTQGNESPNQDGNRPVRTTNAELTTSGLNNLVRIAAIDCLNAAADTTGCATLAAQLTPADGAQHFFDGFAPELAPPLRFGILRC